MILRCLIDSFGLFFFLLFKEKMVRLDLGIQKVRKKLFEGGRFGSILKYIYIRGVSCIRQPTALTTVHLQIEMILRCLVDSFRLSLLSFAFKEEGEAGSLHT